MHDTGIYFLLCTVLCLMTSPITRIEKNNFFNLNQDSLGKVGCIEKHMRAVNNNMQHKNLNSRIQYAA